VTRHYNGTTAATHSVNAAVNFTTDQRGLVRIVNGKIDIGAYETQTSPPPPTVSSMVVNGNPGNHLAGSNSRVATLYVTFNEAVQLDAGAFTLALHPGVVVNGSPGHTVGTLPSSLTATDAGDHFHFTITFNGTDGSTVNVGADYKTIFDGVYDLHVVGSAVHPLGVPGMNMAASVVSTFFAMFGSTGQDNALSGTPGDGHSTVSVGVDDAFNFSAAYGTAQGQAGYDQTLDFDGEGTTTGGGSIGVDAAFAQSANYGAVWQF
jgi:hypothetical protein